MSIATEITRLQGAKADLKTAIEGKGVPVASNATIDAYASLVSTIPTGGGGITLIERGSYTPTEDVSAVNVQIPHDLGVQPDFIVVMADGLVASASYSEFYVGLAMCGKYNITSPQTPNGARAYYVTTRATYEQVQATSEDVSPAKFLNSAWVKVPYYSTSYMLKAGVTYRYVIGKYSAE